jgi:hypothetical protein
LVVRGGAGRGVGADFVLRFLVYPGIDIVEGVAPSILLEIVND